ncbi:MAG: Flp pilus assembly complex ATPase component TadA, partial [Deltaproteobacteria bacterium]|nr:Flp pilus assembly complex ATPase component TadA [Deltaproteobacteria bacterium]
YEIAKKHLAFPVQLKDGSLLVAMTEPTNNPVIDEIKAVVKVPIKSGVATEKEIIEAYKKYYKISEEEYRSLVGHAQEEEKEDAPATVDNLGELIADAVDDFVVEEDEKEESSSFTSNDAPIIKLVNNIMVKAVNDGVSDIHIEPFEKQFYVRYRKDGSLSKAMRLPMEIKNALIARFKIMANLKIDEKRVPQDGRIKMKLGKKREVDFRVSTLPTLFGESVVLRILDKSGLNVDLTKLGFTQNDLSKFMKAINRPNGLMLVTGPTGSGKTVTLYSSLTMRNTDDVKILTAEDPVEYNFSGINQVNVVKDTGMTFPKALKAFLRQDPDICMIGEIRDAETGEIAIEAAMTGHLVLSTLHTNDCPGTITRLTDMGIPSYNIAAAMVLCTAQRLLKRICPKCKQPMTKLSANKLIEAGFDKDEIAGLTLYEGKGCSNCSGTGYKGRCGCFEVLEMTPNLQEAIASNVPESQLRKIAIKEGMNTLRKDGLLKAKQGLTHLDQVLEKTVLQKESLPPYLLNPDEMVFENGDTIIREGNSDTTFYKLIQGCLEVIKGNDKIAEISQPNTYFGEMSSLLGGRRTATIRSVGRSIVKVFPGDKLMETLEGYPDIAKQVIFTLVSRLEDTNKRYVEVINARTDLERTLKAVAPHSAGGQPSGQYRIPFNRPSGQQSSPIGSPMPGSAEAATAPRPLKQPGDQTQSIRLATGTNGADQGNTAKPLKLVGDQTQTIRIAPQAPAAKPIREATSTNTPS